MPLPLHCETFGAGPPLVCLHGFGASNYTWWAIRDSLAASHTVYAIELKGHGQSPKPRDGRYSVHDQAALVVQCLDELKLTGIALVGHSFGGGVALVTALELLRSRPGKLKSLAVLDPASYAQSLPAYIGVLRVPLLGWLLQWLTPVRIQVRQVLRLAYSDDSKIPEASVEAYAAPLRLPGARSALRQTAKQLPPADIDQIAARYADISVPTLIVWGREDAIIPAAFAGRLGEAIRGSRVVIVDKCGHVPHEEVPERAREAIARFLSGG